MIRGFLSDVLAKWKRFRWQGLVKVWAVFMAIALVLLVESLGVHYGATRFDITYLDRNKAIPAANAIAGEKATNLLVVDSSQEGVSVEGAESLAVSFPDFAERPIRRSPFASSFRTSARSPKRAEPSRSLRWLAARRLNRQARNRTAPASRNGMSVAISP